MLIGLAKLLDDLLGSFELIALAAVFGGLLVGPLLFRIWTPPSPGRQTVSVLCARMMVAGAVSLGLVQAVHVAAKAYVIGANLNQSPFPAFFYTHYFQGGAARSLVALALWIVAWDVQRRPLSRARWVGAAVPGVALLLCGAFLVHGASRMEDRTLFMSLSVLHQLGAFVWVGGVLFLASLWHAGRRRTELADMWALALARFSPVGMSAVLLLVTTGGFLTWRYVASWANLVGTAYGFLLASKWILVGSALGFATLNFLAVRRWRTSNSLDALRRTVPVYLDTEAVVLLVLLFVAAAVASLPPSQDVASGRATWREVAGQFKPRMPQLTSPTFEEERAASTQPGVVARQMATAEEGWSNFNHNVSGVILVVIALLALADRTGRFRWGRHWPLGFLTLALFVLLRSDPHTWPLGPVGFFDGLKSSQVLQHKLAVVVTVSLGIMEWRARNAPHAAPWLPFLFPVLCILGGILLLTHSHGAFEMKVEFLTQITHTAIGMLALFMGIGRWMELRLDRSVGRFAGLGSLMAMLLIGLILVIYKEPFG